MERRDGTDMIQGRLQIEMNRARLEGRDLQREANSQKSPGDREKGFVTKKGI